MVEIIIKRKIAIVTGLDKRTLVIPAGTSILLRHDNGDISVGTTERIKTFWDSLTELRQKSIISMCQSERKGLEEIIEEEMKG
jgi:hypothetical protein